MVTPDPHSFRHRPTVVKPNKKFKSRHSTKGQLKAKTKGRAPHDHDHDHKSPHTPSTSSKADRRNTARMIQKKKRDDVVAAQRLYSGLNAVPKVVAVVPLCPDVGSKTVVDALYASMGQESPDCGCGVLTLERFKQRLHLMPVSRNLYAILDACLAADLILFVLSAEQEVDAFGNYTMSCIKTQGVPPTLACVQHLEALAPKQQTEARKSLATFMDHHFPNSEHKVCSIGNDTDTLNLARYLSDKSVKGVAWREKYSRVVAEAVDYDKSEQCLKVTGHVRGMALSASRLVYVPGSGPHQVRQITSSPISSRTMMNLDNVPVLDQPDPALQESLVAVNEPDPLAAEQTWPTDEEIQDAARRLARRSSISSVGGSDQLPASAFMTSSKRKVIRVPKGTSDYQAAWIIDTDEEESNLGTSKALTVVDDESLNDSNNDEEATIMMEEDYEEQVPGDDLKSQSHPLWMGKDTNSVVDDETDDNDDDYEDVDVTSESGSHFSSKMETDENQNPRAKAAQEDLEFPDEVDTPRNMDARVRFQKYRGLKSFRTSPWDPCESLPVDYERIFQFKDFKRTKFKSLKLSLNGTVAVGSRVTVWIDRVSKEVYDKLNPNALTVFALLRHEQKFSVIHFALARPSSSAEDKDDGYNSDVVVKSKDPMIVFSGFRRYVAQPIYSTDTRGGTNNVHKFERYLQPGRTSVASLYGPVTYGPGPVMMFKGDEEVRWTNDAPPSLVATGTLLDPDPTRIIAKRIILTGHPFKIHRRSAVIRFMFHNPSDIAWFRPIQLYTKFGRVGHIKESLGTKGHMKCIFDGVLTQQDTICMALYKRVFPRWELKMYSA
ncbi:hypothetical protein SeLEV6574_g00367 [Synchytrium endobioticum]|uniref:Bms1-type G domain-containing protein n=1 Tax=Synchytrium endobioticum TaxID=286115 RepID=A0A507DHW3_9FUNG|nr:hypothetical protein SeLEV6574_g00367 [Synchytrium endobioticum]